MVKPVKIVKSDSTIKPQAKKIYNPNQNQRRRVFGQNKRNRKGNFENENSGLDIKIVSIRRVTKVKAGGKTLRLSVLVVVGDRFGKIGIAIAKGKDVRSAQEKAVNKAKKNMVKIQLKGNTIPHEVYVKYKAAKLILKPAVAGTGVISGGAVRSVVEAAGVKDILSKVLGTKNVITNVYATFEALKKLKIVQREKNGTK